MNNTSPFSEKVIRLVRYHETQGHYNLGMFNNKEKKNYAGQLAMFCLLQNALDIQSVTVRACVQCSSL